jgi:hypothetical protein
MAGEVALDLHACFRLPMSGPRFARGKLTLMGKSQIAP